MTEHDDAVKVPEGERSRLQDEARAAGVWRGTADTLFTQIAEHFGKLNGSLGLAQTDIAEIKTKMVSQAGIDELLAEQKRAAGAWRMWAIGLGITLALGLATLALSVAGLVIVLLV